MYITSNNTSLQPLLFDFDEFLCRCNIKLSKRESEFASLWNAVAGMLPERMFETNQRGRRGYRDADIIAVRVAMLFFRQTNIKGTLSFLAMAPGVRMVIGMDSIPSESVVSRRSRELAEAVDIDSMFDSVTYSFYDDRTIGNLSIDSTPVEGRETPHTNRKSADNSENKEKKKRGPKPKGSKEEAEYKAKLLEKEMVEETAKTGDVKQFLSTLENRCTITGKLNSKGHMQWRIGYKVHLAVDDMGIPVSFAVTGASVHDSRLAIPLMRMAGDRVRFLYALMDGGYSSGDIMEFTKSMDAVPVIDFKADRNGVKAEMEPAKKIRYRGRTTVERTNSELKDCFLPPKLYSRGSKAILDIKLAVLLLTMKKIRKAVMMLEERKTA